MMHKTGKVIKTLANGYSSESSQWELSYEYQHDKVWMVFKILAFLHKMMQKKTWEMSKTLAYISKSMQPELSYECQHDSV